MYDQVRERPTACGLALHGGDVLSQIQDIGGDNCVWHHAGQWGGWLHPLLSFSLQVAGERYVYKFVCEPEALFSLAFPDNQRPALKAELERQISEEDTVPLSHLDESTAYLPDLGSLPPQLYGKGYTY